VFGSAPSTASWTVSVAERVVAARSGHVDHAHADRGVLGDVHGVAGVADRAGGRHRHHARQLGRGDPAVVADPAGLSGVWWVVGADLVDGGVLEVVGLAAGGGHQQHAAPVGVPCRRLEFLEHRPLFGLVPTSQEARARSIHRPQLNATFDLGVQLMVQAQGCALTPPAVQPTIEANQRPRDPQRGCSDALSRLRRGNALKTSSPKRDASDRTATWKRSGQRFRWSVAVWWACQDLNLGPHPYQGSTAERCANQRSPRSCDSVSPTRMG
jgi:hypothetical protein